MIPIQRVTVDTYDKIAYHMFKNTRDQILDRSVYKNTRDSILDQFLARNDYQGNTSELHRLSADV